MHFAKYSSVDANNTPTRGERDPLRLRGAALRRGGGGEAVLHLVHPEGRRADAEAPHELAVPEAEGLAEGLSRGGRSAF